MNPNRPKVQGLEPPLRATGETTLGLGLAALLHGEKASVVPSDRLCDRSPSASFGHSNQLS